MSIPGIAIPDTVVPGGSLLSPGGGQGIPGSEGPMGGMEDIPLADSTTDGLLKQVSGLTTDFVDGTNRCQDLSTAVGVNLFVKKTGDTMTGNLVIRKTYACLLLHDNSGGSSTPYIDFNTGAVSGKDTIRLYKSLSDARLTTGYWDAAGTFSGTYILDTLHDASITGNLTSSGRLILNRNSGVGDYAIAIIATSPSLGININHHMGISANACYSAHILLDSPNSGGRPGIGFNIPGTAISSFQMNSTGQFIRQAADGRYCNIVEAGPWLNDLGGNTITLVADTGLGASSWSGAPLIVQTRSIYGRAGIGFYTSAWGAAFLYLATDGKFHYIDSAGSDHVISSSP